MEDYTRIIGGNIRYERQKRKFTIEELSDCIGIAPGFLGLIERGQRGTSIKNLCRIAEFFELTLDQLIRENLANADTGSGENYTPRAAQEEAAMTLIKGLGLEELNLVIEIMKNLTKYQNK